MKIFLVSDLHVEFFGGFPIPSEPVDLVILAGDIDVGLGCLEVAASLQENCGVPVIILAGNHEFTAQT